jgi:uncharacterized protein (DUF433 family)
MPPTLSATEVVAFTGLEERRVRKDVEHGFFGPASPPRFELSAVVYFRTVAELGFDLGVEDRRKLYLLIRDALKAKTPPARLALSAITELKLGEIVSEVKEKLERFETWKEKLVEDEKILGGEPVFAKSRLAVRQIGGMLIKGATPEEVREDYPYLKSEDIEFAKLYTLAYPRVGRPREAAAR